jgi:hypothetical protein
MRFMMLVKSDVRAEAGVLPDEQLLTEMGRYNQELAKAGAMLAGEGLQASAKGVRVRLSGGRVTVVDGPFAETKELVAGFWLIAAKSKQEAVEWARRVPVKDGEIEVRRLFELEDFPVDSAEQPDGWRDDEQRFRDGADAAATAAAPPVRKPGTTRFMVMLKADKRTESDALPDEKILTAMGALMQEMAAAGALLSGEGLKPSSTGARVELHGDERTVIDGPFTETKEVIAGYSIIQVKSRLEAVEFAKRWLRIHAEGSDVEQSEIEIRQLFELEDFPVDSAEKPDGWRRQEQRLRERLGRFGQ